MKIPALPPGGAPGVINVIVEIPKGRRSKFEYDHEAGVFRLDRFLYSSSHYPGDYGFVPGTLAEDGDPLDALVMVSEATFSGCLIETRVIGLFRMRDRGAWDVKLLGVPDTDPLYQGYRDLADVPPHFLKEVEHFFATYKQLEGAEIVPEGWRDAGAGWQEVEIAMGRSKDAEDA